MEDSEMSDGDNYQLKAPKSKKRKLEDNSLSRSH
jgi:hypothetical protein